MTIFCSCSSGNGNSVLGNIHTICEDYIAECNPEFSEKEKEAMMEKFKSMTKEQFKAEAEKESKRRMELVEKTIKKFEVEKNKLDGKEVNYEISESLQTSDELYFKLSESPKISFDRNCRLIFNFEATKKLPAINESRFIYLKLVSKDGVVTDIQTLTPFSKYSGFNQTSDEINVGAKANDELVLVTGLFVEEVEMNYLPKIKCKPFTKIIMCTEAEYRAAEGDLRKK